MEKRQLGQSDLMVAPLTMGGNVFGWTIDEARSFEVLDGFTAAGFNLIDTADVYSRWAANNEGGESETIIGNWMKARNNRNDVIIATKVGGDMGQGKKDLSRSYIIRAAEDSLRRLQTDYIDLYQTHWDDDTTPVEETLEAYQQLIKEGKVRWIGASNLSPARLLASLTASEKQDLPRYQTFQPHYNLYVRDQFEKELEQICTDHRLGVISYYSLASGFLTGKYRSKEDLSKSARGGGVATYLDERGFKILAALDQVAARYHTQPASVAIAWLIARPSVTAPIASATSLTQLQDLIAAAQLSLDADAIALLDEASAWR
ncbi:aldo/keto reductase [Taibaiella koreensis]|uniref:aldo/keto reductase n=1 Tax=Taibaiella koreensis TaxID=1268548 RepID=UPI000E59BBF9|nr:aldo/keto reductase [Taibaiella koreensis]